MGEGGGTKQPLPSTVMNKTLTEVIFGIQHLNRLKAGLATAAAATEQQLQTLCEVFLIRQIWNTLFFSMA